MRMCFVAARSARITSFVCQEMATRVDANNATEASLAQLRQDFQGEAAIAETAERFKQTAADSQTELAEVTMFI